MGELRLECATEATFAIKSLRRLMLTDSRLLSVTFIDDKCLFALLDHCVCSSNDALTLAFHFE